MKTSRRHFAQVTESPQFPELPVHFVHELLSSDSLPVTSEAEVLRLIAKWAVGKPRADVAKVRSGRLDVAANIVFCY